MNPGLLQIAVVVASIAYLLVRRWLGEPVKVRHLILAPIVLGTLGAAAVVQGEQSAKSVGFLCILIVVDLAVGALRGASTSIDDRAGTAYVRYTVTTVVLWAAGLALRFGLEFALETLDHTAAEAAAEGLLLTLAAGIVAEGTVVLIKAVRTGANPDWSIRRNTRARRAQPTEQSFTRPSVDESADYLQPVRHRDRRVDRRSRRHHR